MNHLEQADRNTLAGDRDAAAKRLVNLRKHLDGCGAVPGNDDWIVTCGEQLEIRRLLDLLIRNLAR